MIQLFKGGYSIPRESNIIFVCGGNKPNHMRSKFRNWCAGNLQDHIIFLPEYAMEYFFEDREGDPFNLVEFEKLVAEISKAIMIFPEAPGSFAETGYFSAREELAKISILAMDGKYVGKDSFLSMGPAREIEKQTIFHPVIQLRSTKKGPNFQPIAGVIRRYKLSATMKSLDLSDFQNIKSFDLIIFIHSFIDLLTIATFDDVLFIVRGCLGPNAPVDRVKKLLSILIGAKFLKKIGDYGHLTVTDSCPKFAKIKDGRKNFADEIKVTLASLYEKYDDDFLYILEGAKNAA